MNPPALRVKWTDSAGGSRWETFDFLKDEIKPLVCETLGFLLHNAEDYVLLAQSYDNQEDDEQRAHNYIAIPRVSILEMVAL